MIETRYWARRWHGGVVGHNWFQNSLPCFTWWAVHTSGKVCHLANLWLLSFLVQKLTCQLLNKDNRQGKTCQIFPYTRERKTCQLKTYTIKNWQTVEYLWNIRGLSDAVFRLGQETLQKRKNKDVIWNIGVRSQERIQPIHRQTFLACVPCHFRVLWTSSWKRG